MLVAREQSGDSRLGSLEARIEFLKQTQPDNQFVKFAAGAISIVKESIEEFEKARRIMDRKIAAVEYFCSQAEKGEDLTYAQKGRP